MKYSVLLASFALAAVKSERYIISYDELAWNTLSLRYLPANTVHTLKELKMQVADLDVTEISEFSAIPGVTLRKDEAIQFTAYDTEKPSFIENNPSNWGLDRIDQKNLPLDNQYHFDSFGSGVDVWVIDSGVNIDHIEFGGRAIFSANFVGDDKDTDCFGHGTHTASAIAGFTTGVAKGATIHAIKCAACDGKSDLSIVLAGVNHAISEHKKVPGRKSVINMSVAIPTLLGEELNEAVAVAHKAGMVVTAAAANWARDACEAAPASAPEAITVAASNITDVHASWSNYGKCVDIYAPGVKINAADYRSRDGYSLGGGTSIASPIVAGAAAIALEKGIAPADVKKYLIENGSKGVLKDLPSSDTPNVLLNVWRQ